MNVSRKRRPSASTRRVTAYTLNLSPMTDSGNAELIAQVYADVLRFDHKRGRWLLWSKSLRQWRKDDSHVVRMFAIRAARRRRELAGRITDEDEAKKQFRWSFESENRHKLDAALEIAKSLEPISDSGEEWDADPWLLGVANGIVDLRTGTLRPATQQDRISKFSPVAFDPGASCRVFDKFLDEILSHDRDLRFFLWKAVGYSLTGLAREQCFFPCHGLGSNGKSTLLGVLHYILGDYAANLPFSALELKSRNSCDLVALDGARFVTSCETNEGVRLNEGRVKALTGGDLITARALFKMPFSFEPTHKLWLSFNHRPIIADDSEGMWRRVRMIPFNRKFEGEEQDKQLLAKLKAEAPGILAWAVEGCLLWQQEGLGMPPAVAQATAAYRDESDHISEFTEDCCIVEQGKSASSGELWRQYQAWTKANEEVVLPRNTFAERLERRGVKRGRAGREGTRIWVGIGLRADTLTPTDTTFDKSLTREVINGNYTKSASASVSVSASSQKPASNVAISSAPAQAKRTGGAKEAVLEVEI